MSNSTPPTSNVVLSTQARHSSSFVPVIHTRIDNHNHQQQHSNQSTRGPTLPVSAKSQHSVTGRFVTLVTRAAPQHYVPAKKDLNAMELALLNTSADPFDMASVPEDIIIPPETASERGFGKNVSFGTRTASIAMTTEKVDEERKQTAISSSTREHQLPHHLPPRIAIPPRRAASSEQRPTQIKSSGRGGEEEEKGLKSASSERNSVHSFTISPRRVLELKEEFIPFPSHSPPPPPPPPPPPTLQLQATATRSTSLSQSPSVPERTISFASSIHSTRSDSLHYRDTILDDDYIYRGEVTIEDNKKHNSLVEVTLFADNNLLDIIKDMNGVDGVDVVVDSEELEIDINADTGLVDASVVATANPFASANYITLTHSSSSSLVIDSKQNRFSIISTGDSRRDSDIINNFVQELKRESLRKSVKSRSSLCSETTTATTTSTTNAQDSLWTFTNFMQDRRSKQSQSTHTLTDDSSGADYSSTNVEVEEEHDDDIIGYYPVESSAAFNNNVSTSVVTPSSTQVCLPKKTTLFAPPRHDSFRAPQSAIAAASSSLTTTTSSSSSSCKPPPHPLTFTLAPTIRRQSPHPPTLPPPPPPTNQKLSVPIPTIPGVILVPPPLSSPGSLYESSIGSARTPQSGGHQHSANVITLEDVHVAAREQEITMDRLRLEMTKLRQNLLDRMVENKQFRSDLKSLQRNIY